MSEVTLVVDGYRVLNWPADELPQDGQSIIAFLERKFYLGLAYKLYWCKYIKWPYDEPIPASESEWYDGEGIIFGNVWTEHKDTFVVNGLTYEMSMYVKTGTSPSVISIHCGSEKIDAPQTLTGGSLRIGSYDPEPITINQVSLRRV